MTGNQRRRKANAKFASQDHSPQLKDLLSPDIVKQLKTASEQLKAEEAERKEEKRQQAEEERKREQKRRENDFEYLLENSSLDWKKFK